MSFWLSQQVYSKPKLPTEQKAFKYNFKFPAKGTGRLKGEPIWSMGEGGNTSIKSTPTCLTFKH